MEARNIMWIGLAQVLAIVLGFVTLGIVLKFNGWPDETIFRFYPLAKGLRLYGVWLLVVPLLWTIYAMVSMHLEKGLLSGAFAGIVGIILVGMIGLGFLLAVANPGTRGFRMQINPAPASAFYVPGNTSGDS